MQPRIASTTRTEVLASKLLFGGHTIKLVCLPAEADAINQDGIRVRLPVRGRKDLIELNSQKLPGKLSAAGPAAVLVQDEITANVHAAKRHRLRDGPLHCAVCWRYRKALDAAPEGAGGVVAGKAGIGVHIAGDVYGIGSCAEPHDLGVEADGHIEVIFAGQKENCVTFRSELIMLLHLVDLIDLLLHFWRGHRWVEDEHVGPEVWS